METKEKIEYIRAKAIEANPDIKKLRDGSIVSHGDVVRKVDYIIENHPYFASFIWHDMDGKHGTAYDIPKDELEIIGRDIRLADVMLAIGKRYYNNDDSDYIVFTYAGQFIQNEIPSGIYWNLLKDNLTDQSEECISFIYELLVGNE